MKSTWVIAYLMLAMQVAAQDSTEVPPAKFIFNGYIKDLHAFTFNNDYSSTITGSLIHNRINMKYRPVKGFTAAVEMRNRFFWGEEMALTPDFVRGLKYPGESEDLSITWFKLDNMLLYTNIDRLWAEYGNDKWNVRAGRQRINWGIGTLWNPNDIFNTYNFLDFDYEERPASDAVKGQYYFGNMDNLELAVARTGDSINRTIIAAKYFTNYRNYDIQLMAGSYLSQPTMGLGWAGSIGNVGFKGEGQYFFEKDSLADQLNWMMEVDYILKKGWYVNGGALVNTEGIDEPLAAGNLTNFNLSPKNPMPTKWNLYAGVAKDITPLFNMGLSTVYAPGTNLLIVIPSMRYNLYTNLDADLIGQSFFAEQPNGFEGMVHRWFLRIKWSF